MSPLRWRTGAAGRTAIASLPIMRMTWRLRRANSLRAMDEASVQGLLGGGIDLLTKRKKLLEHHLRRDADEFHQLGVGLLVRLVLVCVVPGGAGALREVAYDFAYIAIERIEVGDLTGAEPVQKTGAP